MCFAAVYIQMDHAFLHLWDVPLASSRRDMLCMQAQKAVQSGRPVLAATRRIVCYGGDGPAGVEQLAFKNLWADNPGIATVFTAKLRNMLGTECCAPHEGDRDQLTVEQDAKGKRVRSSLSSSAMPCIDFSQELPLCTYCRM